MPTPLVRRDARGLFVIMDGQRYRPGPLDYSLRPGTRCDEGGLAAGMKVKAVPISSTPVARMTSADGGEDTFWEVESSKDALEAKIAYASANPEAVDANRAALGDLVRPTPVTRA